MIKKLNCLIILHCWALFSSYKISVDTAVSRLCLNSLTSMILLFDHMTENTLFLYLLFYVQISIHISYFCRIFLIIK
jgi:hypothetical protein